jgi:hypothetical protein
MFGTIRKHSSWLWVFLIIVMILGLVFYFSPTAGTGGGPRADGDFGSIDGVKITRNDFVNAQREATVAHLLRSSAENRADFDQDRRTYERLFLLQKIKQYNIHVDEESVARVANNILTQFGGGRPAPLSNFVQSVLGSRATEQDFARYIRTELGLQQLISVVGLAGDLVTPAEARLLYIRENQELSAQVVFYHGSNYQTSVTPPTPEALKEFYTNSMSLYRLPERVQLNYISFEASNHLAQADEEVAALTNLTEIVEQQYQQRGTNFYSEAKSPEEAKQKIREEMRHNLALRVAYRKAEAFMHELFDKEPFAAENLNVLAQTNGLTVKTTEPFDAQTGPDELENGASFARIAFQLVPEQPFFDQPLVGENAIYVAALARRVPSEVPPYDSLEERVLADYKRTKAAETARRAGGDFARTLAEGLEGGKTFAEMVAAAGVKPVTVPAVSLSTQELPLLEERVNLMQFKRAAFTTDLGKVSEFNPTADGGFVVYVEKRLPIDETKMAADLPDFTRMLRQARRSEAVDAWFNREASKSLRDTPLMQSQPSVLPAQERS